MSTRSELEWRPYSNRSGRRYAVVRTSRNITTFKVESKSRLMLVVMNEWIICLRSKRMWRVEAAIVEEYGGAMLIGQSRPRLFTLRLGGPSQL